MRQGVVLALVLALAFGRDVLNAVGGAAGGAKRGDATDGDASAAAQRQAAAAAALDVDAGRSKDLRVHIAYCTS